MSRINETEVFLRIPASLMLPWLQAQQDRLLKILRQHDAGPTLHRAQGEYNAYQDIADKIRKAQDISAPV